MAKIAALAELPPCTHSKSNQRKHDTSPVCNEPMEPVLQDLHITAQDELPKEITSLPKPRRDKVLGIRRQIKSGTYPVANRLARALDRLLEALTC